MPHMIREGFVWARNTTTNAKSYVPAHWVGSSWFPYVPLKSSAAVKPAESKKKNTPTTADDAAATPEKE